MIQVEEKVKATDALMITMAASRQEAEAQQAIASVEKEKATIAAAGAAKIEKEAEGELAEAKPAMDAAAAAVDVLNSAAITELKGFKQPPNGVDKVMACVQMMYAGEMNAKKHTWPNAQKMMVSEERKSEERRAKGGSCVVLLRLLLLRLLLLLFNGCRWVLLLSFVKCSLSLFSTSLPKHCNTYHFCFVFLFFSSLFSSFFSLSSLSLSLSHQMGIRLFPQN